MRNSLKVGFCFGLTTGVITTLGLMMGLYSSTYSVLVVLGGIITIALADGLADALGMHISRESEKKDHKGVWESTIATFVTKFFFTLTFVVPVLLLELSTAVIVCVLWGIILISGLSYYVARIQKISPAGVVAEHLAIALVVIVATYFVGEGVRVFLG